MGKILTIEEIKAKIRPVAEEFGLKRVSIFGSYANGTQTEESDVDFIIEFKKERPTYFDIFDVKDGFANATQKKVDVIRPNGLEKSYLKIKKEVNIYELQ